ncbi:hypothetical protein MVEG_11289 [Podila verticillata NRRL 6337]|uniref:Velvet domain-containing protein n=1 Tax=Podila verticillata NRRL 6337 TaxID=1069443 RepID=A0A086TLD6_9FUNG|nr:hypothetical protein MVEG_11289 [Podila verticillata NRRL 6337]
MHASLIEKDSREEVNLIRDSEDKDKDKDKNKDGTNDRDMIDKEREKEREREISDSLLLKDSRTKATTGSCVSSLYPLKDFEDSGNESGFFVFPDLSVRMEGTYRLKFCLYEMTGTQVHFCASIVSAPFVVYSAKKFPGMEESTTLSQFFAEQGLKIRIRKEVRPKKRSRAGYTSEVPFDTKETKNDNGPSESMEEDESRATDHTSMKRIAISNQDVHWGGGDITRQTRPDRSAELSRTSSSTTDDRRARPQKCATVSQPLPNNRSPDLTRNDSRNDLTRRNSDLSNRRNSDLNRHNTNTDMQDIADLTEIPENDEDYRRSHPSTDHFPGEGPPDGPGHPLHYQDLYDHPDPDYDPDYPPPSPNSTRRNGRPYNDRPGGDRYDRAPGSYPADKRWPPHYMYPGYYYFYYPPPRDYPDPYLRRFDPRYPPYPPPRGPIPYPYLPPEFLARGMVPYPFPPNLRPFHGQDAPYPPPPYPTSRRRGQGGSSEFYADYPYPESYPPPDQDDLQHYYPPDPYGPPRQPPSGNSSSSSSSSQAPRRGYPHPPYPHVYPLYPPYNLPRGEHPEDEVMSSAESTRPPAPTSDQQDYYRSVMSHYPHYPPYHAMDAFESLENSDPESIRPSPRSPSTLSGRGGASNDRRDTVRTPSFNLSLQSPSGQRQGSGSGSGSGSGPEVGTLRRERVEKVNTSEESAQESARSSRSGDIGKARERRQSDSMTTTTDRGHAPLETVRSPSSYLPHDRLGAALEYYGLPLHPRRDIRERYGQNGRGLPPSTDNSAPERGTERETDRGTERGPERGPELRPEPGPIAMAVEMARMMDDQEVQSPPIPMPTGNQHRPPHRVYNNQPPFGSPYGPPYAPHPYRSRNPGSVDSQGRVLTPSMSYSYPPTPLPAPGATPVVSDLSSHLSEPSS